MRGYTFVSIRLNPVRYRPAARTLHLARQMTVTVSYQEARVSLRVRP